MNMNKTLVSRISLRRKLAILACVLMATVLSDEYLLPLVLKEEVVYNAKIKKQRKSVDAFILNAKSGTKYLVTQDAYNSINRDDTFFVHQTFLFRRNAIFTVCKENCRSFYIGTLNQFYTFDYIIGATLVISLLISLGLINVEKRMTLCIVVFAFAFCSFAIYIIF